MIVFDYAFMQMMMVVVVSVCTNICLPRLLTSKNKLFLELHSGTTLDEKRKGPKNDTGFK